MLCYEDIKRPTVLSLSGWINGTLMYWVLTIYYKFKIKYISNTLVLLLFATIMLYYLLLLMYSIFLLHLKLLLLLLLSYYHLLSSRGWSTMIVFPGFLFFDSVIFPTTTTNNYYYYPIVPLVMLLFCMDWTWGSFCGPFAVHDQRLATFLFLHLSFCAPRPPHYLHPLFSLALFGYHL